MTSEANDKKAVLADAFLAILPFLIYLAGFLICIPTSGKGIDRSLYPGMFHYLALIYVLGTLLFALVKQFQRDSFYVWLSFSIFYSLGALIGKFNSFHLLEGMDRESSLFGLLSLDRAWVIALASVILMFLFGRGLWSRPNRLIYPVVVFFFGLSHSLLYTTDLLSFGGVHVDFYDPLPWFRRIMIPTLIIFMLVVIALAVVKKRRGRVLVLVLFFLCHALAWNQSRFFSIQHYTHVLTLIGSQAAYLMAAVLFHVGSFFVKSGAFLFLLLLVPREKLISRLARRAKE